MKKILVLFMVFSLLLTSAFAGGSSESTASDAAKEVTAEDLAGITLEFWHAQTGENGVAMDKVVALCQEQLSDLRFSGETVTVTLEIRQTDEGELQLDTNQLDTIDRTVLQFQKSN